MNIHEFQAKGLFRDFGIPVPRGVACDSVDEVGRAYHDLGSELAVVKAQIHAGGRGKAGGVQLVRSRDEAVAYAQKLRGSTLGTHPTGPEGRVVGKLVGGEGGGADEFRRPPKTLAEEWRRSLDSAGVAVAVRTPRGVDILAGCGQLALRGSPEEGTP